MGQFEGRGLQREVYGLQREVYGLQREGYGLLPVHQARQYSRALAPEGSAVFKLTHYRRSIGARHRGKLPYRFGPRYPCKIHLNRLMRSTRRKLARTFMAGSARSFPIRPANWDEWRSIEPRIFLSLARFHGSIGRMPRRQSNALKKRAESLQMRLLSVVIGGIAA